MRQIPLRNRAKEIVAYALVDDEDYERVTDGPRWCFYQGYARRQLSKGTPPNRTVQSVLLHRVVLGLEHGDGLDADHINRNRLDNQRANLRVVTRGQNAQNTPARAGASSQHRGVSWNAQQRKWVANARLDRKRYYLGAFDSELEAARVAAEWRKANMPYTVELEAA